MTQIKENKKIWKSEMSKDGIELSNLELGLKLITTIDPRGWPHITMISFNRAKSPTQIVWGQFTNGTSKRNIHENPKQGSFYMNAKMPFVFLQAKMDFDYKQDGGEDCEHFSRGQMLKYNTYMNVYRVFYNKLHATTKIRSLKLFPIVKGIIANLIGKNGLKNTESEKKLTDYGFNLYSGAITPKFISYIDPKDDYPIIIPCFQLRAPDKNKLIFPYTQFKDELEQIPKGSRVSTFAVVADEIELTSLIIHGRFIGNKKSRGIKYGIIEIDEIFNSMPPLSGIVYPTKAHRAKVTNFDYHF